MTTRILITALLFGAFLTACNQDDTAEPQNTSLTTVEEWNAIDGLMEDTETMVDELVEQRDPTDDCPTVSFKQPRGQFPNTVTIDFGDACAGPRGHVRSGVLVVEVSAPIYEAGATRVVTSQGFAIDDILVTGRTVVTNQGFDDEGNVTFSRFTDLQFTFPGGATSSWTASFIRTQIAGGSTDEWIDDVFEITGSASGVNRFGVTYQGSIIEPLVKSRDCRWYSDGMIDIVVDAPAGTRGRTLDYGYPDAECDNLVEVDFPQWRSRGG